MPNPKYVMFQRGSQAAYQLLIEKSLVDENTLYFIYDPAEPNKGTLYLGKRLIADGIGSGDAGAKNLVDLLDVQLTDLKVGDLLVKSESGKWINQSPAQIIAAMKAAGEYFETVDEESIERSNGKLQIVGFADAPVGSLPEKGADGKIVWSDTLVTKVGSIEKFLGDTSTSNLQTVIAEAVSKANHLKYQVITDIAEATEENIIYLLSNGSSDNNKYDEYIVVNGAPEKIGVFTSEIEGYVTNVDFDAYKETVENELTAVNGVLDKLDTTYVKQAVYAQEVGILADLQKSEENTTGTIVEEINCINSRLTWQEMSET